MVNTLVFAAAAAFPQRWEGPHALGKDIYLSKAIRATMSKCERQAWTECGERRTTWVKFFARMTRYIEMPAMV